MIVFVQITRPFKEAHKHIPDAVLFVALGFIFQIIDCNEWSSLYFTGQLVYFKRKCSCCQIKSMQIQAWLLFEIILHSHKCFTCCRLKIGFIYELYGILLYTSKNLLSSFREYGIRLPQQRQNVKS